MAAARTIDRTEWAAAFIISSARATRAGRGPCHDSVSPPPSNWCDTLPSGPLFLGRHGAAQGAPGGRGCATSQFGGPGLSARGPAGLRGWPGPPSCLIVSIALYDGCWTERGLRGLGCLARGQFGGLGGSPPERVGLSRCSGPPNCNTVCARTSRARKRRSRGRARRRGVLDEPQLGRLIIRERRYRVDEERSPTLQWLEI